MVVVMGLSGGMDSATLLGLLLEQGHAVHCCSFTYGSKHNAYEGKAAEEIVQHYNKMNRYSQITHHQIDLTTAFALFQSDLLKSGGDIPEGHYNDETMKSTVVPGRNMIMASIMAGLAESLGADAIALGVHSGDHHIYPDCRKEFIKALDSAIYLSSGLKIQVLAPLIDMDKGSILFEGAIRMPVPVPYWLSRTCYKNQELSCGKCGSCRERLEAFKSLKMKDSIKYEN